MSTHPDRTSGMCMYCGHKGRAVVMPTGLVCDDCHEEDSVVDLSARTKPEACPHCGDPGFVNPTTGRWQCGNAGCDNTDEVEFDTPLTRGAVSPTSHPEFDVGYYSGVADALDVIRGHDFPDTTRVDLLADKLAPSTTRGAVDPLTEALAALRWVASNADVPSDFPNAVVRLRQIASRASEALIDTDRAG